MRSNVRSHPDLTGSERRSAFGRRAWSRLLAVLLAPGDVMSTDVMSTMRPCLRAHVRKHGYGGVHGRRAHVVEALFKGLEQARQKAQRQKIFDQIADALAAHAAIR